VPRTCILSPHPDDAVWSLGGWLAIQAKHSSIVVITVFDGDVPVARYGDLRVREQRWRSLGTPSLRRTEDDRAMAAIGGRAIGLGFLDGAIREGTGGAFLYDTLEALFARPPIMETALVEQVANGFSKHLRPDDVVLAPLALGDHVDHRIVREAATQLPRGVSGWYEDFPYVQDLEDADIHKVAREVIGRHALPILVESDFDAWIRSALCYRSQVLRLYGSGAAFEERLSAYAWGRGDTPSARIWWTACS